MEKEKIIIKDNKKSDSSLTKLIIGIVATCLIIAIPLLIQGNKKGYTQISYTELNQKLENKESFVLFIGSDSCSACKMFKDILKDQYKKSYKTNIYYLDVSKLSEAEQNKMNTKFDYSQTPTSFIIVEGQTTNQDKYEGSDKLNQIIEALKKKGLIGE